MDTEYIEFKLTAISKVPHYDSFFIINKYTCSCNGFFPPSDNIRRRVTALLPPSYIHYEAHTHEEIVMLPSRITTTFSIENV